MKFNNTLKYPKLPSIDTDKGRFYIAPNGERYPSVTTVLGSQSKEWIETWKNRIGHEEANIKMNYAKDRGTLLHNTVERYLKGDKINWLRENPIVLRLFDQIQPFLDKAITEVWAIEETLYSDYLKVAGRVDLIALLKNGKPCIIDFKTSDKTKQEGWIENYFIQASVYAQCFGELFNIVIEDIVIIIATENNMSKPSIFAKKSYDYINKFEKIRNEYDAKLASV